MNGDLRGWRVALLPDALVNPQQQQGLKSLDVLGLLDSNGYGVLQLPPAGAHGSLLAVIADQVAEYSHHGYAVVAVGLHGEPGNGLHWRRLSPLLRHRAVPLPPRFIFHPEADAALERRRLASLLAGYDLPAEQQRHWRV